MAKRNIEVKNSLKESNFGKGGTRTKDGTFGNSIGLTPKGNNVEGKNHGSTQEAPILKERCQHQTSP